MIPGAEHRLGSDSCYSKSDNSSTDSDSTRRHKFVQKQEIIEKLHREQEEVARLERLCPRVRQPLVTCPRQKHVYTDTTSLSSVDTNSSSDLWNVRAMPDVTVTRLPDKPISLRANPAHGVQVYSNACIHLLNFLHTQYTHTLTLHLYLPTLI